MIPIHREGQTEEADHPELLHVDEDEQDRLIEDLRLQNSRQQAQMERIFGYLCRLCAALSTLLGLFVELRQWNSASLSMAVFVATWAHISLSVLQNVNSFSLFKPETSWVLKVFPSMAINALFAVVGMFLARRRQLDDRLHLHYSLLAGNILVLSMGLLLRRDQRLTSASIDDLQSKKYHFKSL